MITVELTKEEVQLIIEVLNSVSLQGTDIQRMAVVLSDKLKKAAKKDIDKQIEMQDNDNKRERKEKG